VLAFLSLVPSVGLILVMGWCLAMLFGLLTVRFRDTAHLSEIGFNVLFYLTPVIYPPDAIPGRVAWMLRVSPLTPFLDMIRQPVLYGDAPSLQTYAAACLIVASLVVAASLAMRSQERRLIFHL
jgi:ABC-type polysaccharide/polyol phosphate export permease